MRAIVAWLGMQTAKIPADGWCVQYAPDSQLTLNLVGILFEPPPRDSYLRPTLPVLRLVNTGQLVLVYDDIFNGPQIVRSNLNELPSNP
jgi:hypothetical protein